MEQDFARSTGGRRSLPDVATAWEALVTKATALTDISATIRDRHGDEVADALVDLFDAMLRSELD